MREKGSRKEKEGRSRVAEWRRRVRADKELEKKARDGTLQVPFTLKIKKFSIWTYLFVKDILDK